MLRYCSKVAGSGVDLILLLGTSPPLTEASRALRVRNAEKVSQMSPGASGPGTPKSLQKVSGTAWEVSGKCRKSLFGLFPRLFGDISGFRGQRPQETFFETLSAFRARRARKTSVRGGLVPNLVAHDCGYPLSRYTCRATRVAADFLDFIAFCRCGTGVALHPLKILVSHLPPPLVPGGVAPKFGS